jgi:L-histidine Nalpha-methyltransferase
MHLVSRRRQRIVIPAAAVDLVMRQGETIWTESSYKYEPTQILSVLAAAGFRAVWQGIDETGRFALTCAEAA